MKQCTKCKEVLPLENFNKKDSKRLQPRCKPCQREDSRERYHRDPVKIAAKMNANKRARREKMNADIRYLKETTPCTDCGLFFKWYQYDFDHVNGKKSAIISEMVRNGAARWRVFSEITKCEIVCANCHRERTFTRGETLPEEVE